MIRLGVNIDHAATLRQARYRENPEAFNAEPAPIAFALDAECAGAAGITAHLRADRRHMQDSDLEKLRAQIRTRLNLEMGNTPEILNFALHLKPDAVCLVPENREEVTTEGGLDCAGQIDDLALSVHILKEAGVCVSLFIDPEETQVHAASAIGADFIELHTGAYANALPSSTQASEELQRLEASARLAFSLGLRVNAGHGLNYQNVLPICRLPHLEELNIGHSIVSRALSTGIKQAVKEMLALFPQ